MQLGYLVFSAREPTTWPPFFEDVLGLQPAGPDRWRLDGYAWRLATEPGERDDLAAVGWLFEPDELDAVLQRLADAGHAFTEADPAVRSVDRRYVGHDPAGIPTELVTGLASGTPPFAPSASRGALSQTSRASDTWSSPPETRPPPWPSTPTCWASSCPTTS